MHAMQGQNEVFSSIIVLFITIAIAGAAYITIGYYFGGLTEKSIRAVDSYASGGSALMVIQNTGTKAISLLPCEGSGKTITCGDITITKTQGEGDMELNISKAALQPREAVVITDLGAREGDSGYTVSSPSIVTTFYVNIPEKSLVKEDYYCSAVNIENYCNKFDGNYYNKSLCLDSGCNAKEILGCDGADATKEGNVDFLDSVRVSTNYGKTGCKEPGWCDGADATKDGNVDFLDSVRVSTNYGKTGCGLEENARIDCYTISNCKDKDKELCSKESGCLWIPSQIKCENPFLKASWSSTLDILADGAFNKSNSTKVPNAEDFLSVAEINEDYALQINNTNKSGCIYMPMQNTYHCFERVVEKNFDISKVSWGGTIYVNFVADFPAPQVEAVFVGAYINNSWYRNFGIGFVLDGIAEKYYIYFRSYGYNAIGWNVETGKSILLATMEEGIPNKWIKIDWFFTPKNNLFARVENGEWKKIPPDEGFMVRKDYPFTRIDVGFVSGLCRENCNLYIKNLSLYDETCLPQWMKELES